MQKNKSNGSRRTWNLLRLVLLWTRKGGVYRRRLMVDLRLVPKFLKTLGQPKRHLALPYGEERQLSFDKTPIVHIKMHRPSSMRFKMPNIPCLNPQVEFDFDYEYNNECDAISYCNEEEARKSFLMSASGEEDRGEGDEAIDIKAEEFIANFYKQMKLQRQISNLQYN